MHLTTQRLLILGGLVAAVAAVALYVILRVSGYIKFAPGPTSLPCSGPEAECALAVETVRMIPGCGTYVNAVAIHEDNATLEGYTSAYGNMWLAAGLEPNQLRALVIHECAHAIDFRGLTGTPRGASSPFTVPMVPTFADDPSLNFYSLSWKLPVVLQPKASDADFVSVYARTRAIEDFAESYTYYVLQRSAFQERAKRNATLRKKYEYMQQLFPAAFRVAEGEAWDGIIPSDTSLMEYNWLAAPTPSRVEKAAAFAGRLITYMITEFLGRLTQQMANLLTLAGALKTSLW